MTDQVEHTEVKRAVLRHERGGEGVSIWKSDKFAAARLAIDVWAACFWHRAAGGVGLPTVADLMDAGTGDVEDPVKEQGGVIVPSRGAMRTSSEYFYDASVGKYERASAWLRSSEATLSEVVLVEGALRAAGDVPLHRKVLLWAHPEAGRFMPRRPRGWESESPFKSLCRSHVPEIVAIRGLLASGWHDRAFEAYLKQVHKELVVGVKDALRTGMKI